MEKSSGTKAELLEEIYALKKKIEALEHTVPKHKQMDDALKESEEKHRILLDESPDLFFSLTSAGLYRYANRAFAEGVGKPIEEIIGRTMWDVFPKDEADKRFAALSQVFHTGGEKVVESRVPRPDGDCFYITTITPVKDKLGNVEIAICSSKDITERKKTENVLAFLAQSSSNPASIDFFHSLAQYISEALDMGFVCIDRLDGDNLTAHTVAVYSDGKFEDNVSYALKDTPCGEVVGKHVCCFPASIKNLFPNDAVLQQMEAESYIGVTLWSHDGRPIGLIAVIGARPLTYRTQAESLLKLVAVRAAAELERNQAEAALLASEKRFQSLFNNMSDGVAVYKAMENGEHFIFVDINKKGEELNNVCKPEIIGKSVEEVFPGIKEMGLLEVFKKVWQTGEPQQYPVSLYYDGHLAQWFKNYVYKLPSGEIVAVYDDVTEAMQMELALQESEKTHRALIAGLPDVVMRFDQNGRHLFVSENVSNVVELQAAQFIGKTHRELGFSEALCLFWEEAINGVFNSGKPFETEFSFESIKGPAINNWRLIPELNAQGQINSVLSLSRDITAHRRSEQDYRTLFNEMLDGFALHEIICDEQGNPADYRFLAVNPAFERMTGLKAEVIVGRTVLEIMPGTELHWIKTYGKVALTGEPILFENYAAELKKYFEVRAFQPAPRQFACIFADITDRKCAEEDKRELQERLNRAEKMEALGTLAGGVAHDLNNVLGVVVGYAELSLGSVDKSSPLRRSLENVMNGGLKASAIVDDLLTLARRGVPGRSIINLNKIIADYQKSPEFDYLSYHHPTVKIKTDLDPELHNILGSSVHLGKSLYNLVSNSHEAMPKGGTLRIKTTNQYLDKPTSGYDTIKVGDYVVLSVSDEGEGISETDLKRIFEPFYTKKIMGRSGTGLGLAVVWGTVKDHNGYINVLSEEGKGSTFTLYFPITREEAPAAAVAVAISEYMGQGESILVVDDVKEQRDLAARMLKSLNYNVSCVASGEDALEYLKKHKVDLILLDMIMDPGMDGLDTYKGILAICPDQKTIVVSGFSESDRVHDAQALGAGAYVKKPYVKENLGLAVKKELEKG